MTVKRYQIEADTPYAVLYTREDRMGEFVYYSEYAELQRKFEVLAGENSSLKSAFNPNEISEAAIDAFSNTATFDWDSNESGSWTWVENDSEVIRAVLSTMSLPETPATDAILAEIRAQGVDGAIETIIVHMNHQHVAVKGALHILKMYSEQLRRESGQ